MADEVPAPPFLSHVPKADLEPEWLLSNPARIAARTGEVIWFVDHIHNLRFCHTRIGSHWSPTGHSVLYSIRVGPMIMRNTGRAWRRVRIRKGLLYDVLTCVDLDHLHDSAADKVRAVDLWSYVQRPLGMSSVFADERRAIHRQVLIRLTHEARPVFPGAAPFYRMMTRPQLRAAGLHMNLDHNLS